MGKQMAKYNQKLDQFQQKINETAKSEGINPSGVTILGGKPYINVTGLDMKLRNICEEKNWVIKEISVAFLQRPARENAWTAGFMGYVKLFDQENFQKVLGTFAEKGMAVSDNLIAVLQRSYTYIYKDEGWANPESCSAIAYSYVKDSSGQKKRANLLPDNVVMMASRRATNRAKREATGIGLTSTDEIATEPEGSVTGPTQTEQSKMDQHAEFVKKMQNEINQIISDPDFPDDKRQPIERYISDTNANFQQAKGRAQQILGEAKRAKKKEQEVGEVTSGEGELSDSTEEFDPFAPEAAEDPYAEQNQGG